MNLVAEIDAVARRSFCTDIDTVYKYGTAVPVLRAFPERNGDRVLRSLKQ